MPRNMTKKQLVELVEQFGDPNGFPESALKDSAKPALAALLKSGRLLREAGRIVSLETNLW